MNKMNWGCGDKLPEGWVNVDHEDFGGNVISDIRTENLPFPDNHFDFITAQHALSMLDYQTLPKALKELHRVLKSGGVLRIVDFDPVQAFRKYEEGDEKGLIIPDYVEPTIDGKFCAYLTWYGTRLSLLTEKAWIEKVNAAGFLDVQYTTFKKTNFKRFIDESAELDIRPFESNFVEGIK